MVRWPYWGTLVGGCYTWEGPTQLRDFGGRGQGGLKVVFAEPRDMCLQSPEICDWTLDQWPDNCLAELVELEQA